MAIRETMQRHPTATMVISVAVILTAMGVAFVSHKKSALSSDIGQWFTCDDGASWFVDSPDLIPPFDHKGKVAVIAHVAKQDVGSGFSVIYLERYTPDAKAVSEKIRNKSPVSADDLRQLAVGHEYKAPGESNWRTFANPTALTIWAHDLAEKAGCGKRGFVDPS